MHIYNKKMIIIIKFQDSKILKWDANIRFQDSKIKSEMDENLKFQDSKNRKKCM